MSSLESKSRCIKAVLLRYLERNVKDSQGQQPRHLANEECDWIVRTGSHAHVLEVMPRGLAERQVRFIV